MLNHDEKPVDLEIRIDAASDFADLFEVKDALKKKGTYRQQYEAGQLVVGYTRETFRPRDRDHRPRSRRRSTRRD